MSLKTGRKIDTRKWIVLHVTESIIGKAEQLAADKGINEMVYGEMIFEWKPGDPILLQPYYEKFIPISNHATNEETRVNVGHDVIIFGEEEIDITEDNISED